jgi:hypothetical protein
MPKGLGLTEMEKPGVPIVCLFSGQELPHYAQMALAQAKLLNFHSTTYLISALTEKPGSYVELVPAGDFGSGAHELGLVYLQFGYAPRQVPMTKLARWFVVREFLQKRNIERCFCMDLDVLLFCDVTALHAQVKDCDFTVLGGDSWSQVFFNNRQPLDDFCAMALDVFYRGPSVWPKVAQACGLLTPYAKLKPIDDQMLLPLFLDEIRQRYHFADLASPDCKSILDYGLAEEAPDFEAWHGQKRLVWEAGLPHLRRVSDNSLLRLDSLHFRTEGTRALMPQIFKDFTEARKADAK